MKSVFGASILLSVSTAFAAGPSDVAKADQKLWPKPITSHEEFDAASRSEMLVFLAAFRERSQSLTKPEDFGIKKLNTDSLAQFKKRASDFWLAAYRDAVKSCAAPTDLGCGFKGQTFEELTEFASKFEATLPIEFAKWSEMSRAFNAIYLKELMRLAALFPNPTSEILPLSDQEVFGDKFKDGEFLITLDDGPSNNEITRKTADILRGKNVHAAFFALGNALDRELKSKAPDKISPLYEGQCLHSHGYTHVSHQKLKEWKDSLTKTETLVQKVRGDQAAVHFRPPYGQRTAELDAFLGSKNEHVILWNIDSQDWHSKIAADQVADRVWKLMLIWRKGMILMHDVHPKAQIALPKLFDLAEKSKLSWYDCHSLGH